MPAVTLRNSSIQRANHCQVLIASPNSKSRPERSLRSVVSGSQPSGLKPSGGFLMKNDAPTTMTA